MTKSFRVDLTGKLELTHGPGPRITEGRVTFAPAKAAIHSDDVELKTIHSLFLTDYLYGTYLTVSVVNPGTIDNYASVMYYSLATTGVPAAKTGTITVRYLAIGE